MAEGDVWISKFFSDMTYVRATEIDRDAPGWGDFKENRTPPPETLPLPIYASYMDETFQEFPPIFEGAGGTKISPAMAEVFRQFDLGRGGGIFPIQLYLHDRKTPAQAEYRLLVFREEKDGLIPEESQGLRAGKYESNPPTRWMMSEVKNGDIAVRATARLGSDLWFDPQLPFALFMSDRLVQALKEVGFAKHFKPIRCRVVELH